MNRISPAPPQDGDSNPVPERHMGSQENMSRDVSANWNIESTPQVKETEQQDEPEAQGERTDWDLESDARNDHFEAADNENSAHKAQDLDESKDEAENEGLAREDKGYKPELPMAITLEKSFYESPNASRTDLNEHSKPDDHEMETVIGTDLEAQSPDRKDGPELAREFSDTNAPVKTKETDQVYGYSNGLQEDVAGSRSISSSQSMHLVPLPGKNRVSPIDDAPVKQSQHQYFELSKGEQLKKKSVVIGADDNAGGIGCCAWLLYTFSILLIVVTLPFSLIFCIKVVQEYERAVIFRLGRLPSGGAKGPGIFFIIPCIESYTKIDLRTVSFDVPPQEVLTKDSVTVSVDAVVYYRVSNPTVSVANVENAHHSTRLLAQTTLRNILGTKNMSEILSDRESISQGMQSTLDEATENWGIKVERVEIKDVRLPVQLQRAMAAEAEAAREARAKVIAAEGEQKASWALKEAADVMAKSSAALQLRYLQTLSSISAEKNSTIIFPLPIDLVTAFMDKKKS